MSKYKNCVGCIAIILFWKQGRMHKRLCIIEDVSSHSIKIYASYPNETDYDFGHQAFWIGKRVIHEIDVLTKEELSDAQKEKRQENEESIASAVCSHCGSPYHEIGECPD